MDFWVCRAHMDWDSQYMWQMAANATTGDAAGGSDGQVVRLRMDGIAEEELPGLERAHHDFAVLPGGFTAFLVVADESDTGIVERAPDGTLTTIVVLNDESYLSGGTSTHPQRASVLRARRRPHSWVEVHEPGYLDPSSR